jgi:acyl-CoA reductase-like NAD-dependent aldehyde dehydrogenase
VTTTNKLVATDSLKSKETIIVLNPATEQIIAEVPCHHETEVEEAINLARTAFESWSITPAIERAALLQDFAHRLRESAQPIASQLVSEGGKSIVEAELEVAWAAEAFDYFSGLARQRAGHIAPPNTHDSMNLVVKTPVGVVTAILPWNFPLLLWAWKAAPALAAGNCVIAKPSPVTPLSLLKIQELLALPEGVHQVVSGFGEVGVQLVDSPKTDMVAFTGTSETGVEIMQSCARQSKAVIAEMSGNDPFIVWSDVDIETAVEAVVFAAFVNAGQVCTSAERIYVADEIYDSFAQALAERTSRLRIGDPADPKIDIGPLATAENRDRVAQYVERACAAGATLLAGGKPLDRQGYYFAPTVLGNVSHEFLSEAGEIFGPVAPLVRVHSFDEALHLANDSPYGLGANVLTEDLTLAMKASRDLRFGTVWVNSPLMDNYAAPFGGFRKSGMGRELGEEGFDAFLETKHISLDFALTMQPWWFNQR